jgi:hypothetical protein
MILSVDGACVAAPQVTRGATMVKAPFTALGG